MKRFFWSGSERNLHKVKRFALRSCLAIGIGASFLLIFLWGSPIYRGQLQEGDIAFQSIYAPFNFTIKGEIDEIKTQEAKKNAEASVRAVLDLDLAKTKPEQDSLSQLAQELVTVQQIKEATDEEKKAKLLEKLSPNQLELSSQSLETLLEETSVEDWKQRLQTLLNSLFTQGILTSSEKKELQSAGITGVLTRNVQARQEENRELADLLDEEEARSKIESLVYDHFPESRRSRQAAIEILKQLIIPCLFFNNEETERRKKSAAESVAPLHRLVEIKKNELIITQGQRVTRRHLEMLSALEQEISKANRSATIFGIILLIALTLAIFVLYLKRQEPKILSDNSKLLLFGTIAVLTLALSKCITFSPFSSFLMPIPASSMLATILVNPSAAILMTLSLTLLAAVMVSNKFSLIVVMLSSGMIAVYASNRIRRRSDILRVGFWAGLVAAFSAMTVSLINGLNFGLAVQEAGWGVANGFLCAFIVMGSLPFFETLFQITTNINLLELSDLNHPLLRELVIKAPGTYHHSLVVGNLAESACEAISANALLARVGAYYHDIGKMEKAEYFTENQMDSSSKHRHEKLSPHMSSLIIASHIKNGIELAQQNKLPKPIIDFIPEHQGTSLIYFFYQKALQQAKDGETVKEEDFRYPGPKPQTKETAVVLLADSVEAASRSLSDPTPARIGGLVRKMINNKFIDGQLDECNLTLRDLNIIAETFVRVLTGTFHTRVPYPEPQSEHSIRAVNDHKDKKSTEKSPARSKTA